MATVALLTSCGLVPSLKAILDYLEHKQLLTFTFNFISQGQLLSIQNINFSDFNNTCPNICNFDIQGYYSLLHLVIAVA